MQKIKSEEQVNLKDHLFFVGTIYESFEALEEVMGKLKLERPLFLIYLAKKSFAEEVFKAAGEKVPLNLAEIEASSQTNIEIFNQNYH